MNVDNLVRMANQIGQFFEAMPDRPAALSGIANHLRKFWAPRMRERLSVHQERDGGAGLSPIVLDALARHSIRTPPVPADPRDPMKGSGSHELDGASES